MKVLCIQTCTGTKKPSCGGIFEGNTYDVLDSKEFPAGLSYLIFKEDAEYWYTVKHFILLSDKDETEYADQVLKQLFQPVTK